MERLPAAAIGLTSGRRPAAAKAVAAVLLAVAVQLAGMAPAMASTSLLDTQQLAYREAVLQARAELDRPGKPAAGRAALAASTLRLGAPGEVEALRLLDNNPPDLGAARERLDASIQALDAAAGAPDPAGSERRLQDILAQPRYHPDQGPLGLAGRLARGLLEALLRPGPLLSVIFLALLAAMVLGAAALLVPGLRQALRRAGGAEMSRARARVEEVPAYFREAEAHAAAGDFEAAVRALTAGTMELATGERSFAASPLTVREAFARSGSSQLLGPLRLAFERSHYGHHAVAGIDYQPAAAAAMAFREARRRQESPR